MEALKAIYEEDFRVVDEREKSLRITIRSDDGSLSLDLLVRLREREREDHLNRQYCTYCNYGTTIIMLLKCHSMP